MLVVLIAVFLAYNANRGLPFVPTKELKVDIANGANLTVGSDVREGGYRIGLVSDMNPIRLSSGQTVAQLTLQLNNAYGRVPINSTAAIRPASVLGQKYVDLHKGTSGEAGSRRRHIAAFADDTCRSSSTTSSRPSTRAHAKRSGRTWSGLREHVGRPRLGVERHDREPSIAVWTSRAGGTVAVGSADAS